MFILCQVHISGKIFFLHKQCKTLSLLLAGSVGLAAAAPPRSETLTSHWVEAAQGVEVPRRGSLLKELQIKLDITPKNRTRVRVRAGSASGVTLQHSKARSAEAPRQKNVEDKNPSQHNRT